MAGNVLITTSSFGVYDKAPLKALENAGFTAVLNPYGRKITVDETNAMLGKYKPVGVVAGTEKYSRPVLELASGFLKTVSRVGAGWDNVDLNSAEEFGIKVFRTPDSHAPAVAELAVGMMLSVLRQISRADRNLRNGNWKPIMGSLLSGKTVGIIGFGRVGRLLAKILLNGFGAKVAWYDPFIAGEGLGGTKKCGTLEELMAASDIVSLHVPGGEGVLIGEKELAWLKQGAILINTSRGGLVDEEALLKGLGEGRIGGAGLDVYGEEPYTGPLRGCETAVLTMHMGSYAMESRVKMEMEAVDNLLAGMEGMK